jgi:hypothetical protein
MTGEGASLDFERVKSLLLEGDSDAARIRIRHLLHTSSLEVGAKSWRDLALLLVEANDVALAREILEAGRIETDEAIVLHELIALAPKIPSAYLRLFAEGARVLDVEATRTQLLALKKRNLSDAGEVFGQLGLRAPTLRKAYGKLIDPLLQEDGTARSTPLHWGWLGGGLVALLTLLRIFEALPTTRARDLAMDLSIEVDESDSAALDSAVNIVCADRPAQCAEARAMQTHIREASCTAIVPSAPDEDSVVGDAMRLLHQRAQQACEPH